LSPCPYFVTLNEVKGLITYWFYKILRFAQNDSVLRL